MNTTETTERVGSGDALAAPVLMECLGGGRRIVRVGDVVTPFRDCCDETLTAWLEWTVRTVVNDGGLELKAPNGKTTWAAASLFRLTSNSELQARAQLESVKEMVAALEGATAIQDEDLIDAARAAIQEDALSVEVRSGWIAPGSFAQDRKNYTEISPAEFKILLCTGGPAVQIIGTLGEHGEPETAKLQHQDWGTPWTDYRLTAEEEAALVAYASEFCFA